MAVLLGHSYSPYIGFKGGKGVATSAGSLLVLTPGALLTLLAVFAIIVVISRRVSLGSVIVAFAYPPLCLWFYPGQWTIFGFSLIAAGLVIWRHRANIGRIIRGEEPKISMSGRGSAAKGKGDS
jgi:glycerol-3-phosphate acyltransferase PlsY